MDVEVALADLRKPEQARALVEILDSYARDRMGGARALPPAVRERVAAELAARDTALVLFAFAGGVPVGAAVCFLGFSTFAARPLLNVHDLAVLPEFRG